VLARDVLAILAVLTDRSVERIEQGHARGDEPPRLLVTDGEVEDRTAAGIQPVALLELRAGLAGSPGRHEGSAFFEETFASLSGTFVGTC
jgi:hypothetical protein